MDKQQGPAVEHRELYSTSCDKPLWETMKKKIRYIYIWVYFAGEDTFRCSVDGHHQLLALWVSGHELPGQLTLQTIVASAKVWLQLSKEPQLKNT